MSQTPEMYLKVALSSLVIFFMCLEFFGTAAAALPPCTADHPTIHSQQLPSSLLAAFLFEKTEEETSKSEAEKERATRIVLLDFSRVAFSLSYHHTLRVQFVDRTFLSESRPPVDQLSCVLLI